MKETGRLRRLEIGRSRTRARVFVIQVREALEEWLPRHPGNSRLSSATADETPHVWELKKKSRITGYIWNLSGLILTRRPYRRGYTTA